MLDKKEIIFQAGKDLFGKYGPKKVSIDAIIEQANVGKGTFYNYFSSKEELYENIIDEILRIDYEKKKIRERMMKGKSKEELLMAHLLGTLFFIEKNDIVRNICLEKKDYFFGKIDYLYLREKHIEILKTFMKEESFEDFIFLTEMIWAYGKIFTKRAFFESEEKYEEFYLRLAKIYAYGYFQKDRASAIDIDFIKSNI